MNQSVKSPFTGGRAQEKVERRQASFRGKEYTYWHKYYECAETHEAFTTSEQDELNVNQIYNQYREHNGIPFPNQLREARQKYGLGAQTMSTILGLGANQYRLYENGEMPNLSNGRLLSGMLHRRENLLWYIESAREALGPHYERTRARVLRAPEEGEEAALVDWLFAHNARGAHNGYAPRKIGTLHHVLHYFLSCFSQVPQATMNKLLFYADFFFYQAHGVGLTGLSYQTSLFGPVPLKFSRIYAAFNDIESTLAQQESGALYVVLERKDHAPGGFAARSHEAAGPRMGAIGAGSMGAGAIGMGDIGAGNMRVGDMGTGSIGARNVGSGNIGAESIGAGDIGAGAIGARNVGSGNIGAESIGAGDMGTRSMGAGNTKTKGTTLRGGSWAAPFSKEQENVLQCVADKFSALTPAQITALSLQEAAWQTAQGLDGLIDYNLAFTLPRT